MAKKIKADIEADYRKTFKAFSGGVATLDGGTIFATTGKWTTGLSGIAVGSGWSDGTTTTTLGWTTSGTVVWPTFPRLLTEEQRAMVEEVILEQIAKSPSPIPKVAASKSASGWSWSYTYDEK